MAVELSSPAVEPLGSYVFCVRSAHQAHAVAIPVQADGTLVTGKIGDDLSIEDGHAAARLAGLNLLVHRSSASPRAPGGVVIFTHPCTFHIDNC
jgi:hypothetical protein